MRNRFKSRERVEVDFAVREYDSLLGGRGDLKGSNLCLGGMLNGGYQNILQRLDVD